MVLLRAGRRLLKTPKTPRPDLKLRASLRRIKKRWNIPDRIRDSVEDLFTEMFGKSPRGTTWSALAERYPERFKDYVDQAQEELAE